MADQLEKTDAQFVTLGIDRELFAVPVETVLEILDMREMFRVPDAPPHLAGLIDVRGRSVPVIDLRVKLGLAAVAATHGTRIMVLEVPVAGRQLGSWSRRRPRLRSRSARWRPHRATARHRQQMAIGLHPRGGAARRQLRCRV
jgi:CheW-like domain